MAKKSGKAKRGTAKKVARVKRAPTKKAKTARPARPKAAAKRVVAKRPAKKAPAPPAPQTNPVRELAKKIVDLTVSGNDEATFALYADNVVSVEMNQPPMVGVEAIKQKFQMWRGMTSSADFRARNVWVDGNTVIIEWEARCTLAATGKTVDLREVAIHEIENGKIARERFYYDPTVLQG